MAFRDKPNGAIESSPFKPPLRIKKLPGVIWGGVVTPGAIDYWRAKAFSPITLPEPEFDVNKGIVARGKIPKPTIKLLEKVDFSVVVAGDVSLQAEISASDLTLPGPFKVLGGSMVVSAGTSGVGVKGDINFEIEKLAKGLIGAGAKASSSADLPASSTAS